MNKLLKFSAAALMLAAALTSCQEETGQDTLEVSPMSEIAFNATDNEAVVLTVTTTAPAWNAESSDWILTSAEGNTLTVNVKDNAREESRSGSIIFSAAGAKTVNIPVSQPYVVDEPVLNDGQPGRLADVTDGTKVELTVSETDGSAFAEIVYTLDDPAKPVYESNHAYVL